SPSTAQWRGDCVCVCVFVCVCLFVCVCVCVFVWVGWMGRGYLLQWCWFGADALKEVCVCVGVSVFVCLWYGCVYVYVCVCGIKGNRSGRHLAGRVCLCVSV